MIAKITGMVGEINGLSVTLETNSGLSFEIKVLPSLIQKINLNQKLSLYTSLVVSESSLSIYGFESRKEKDFFNLLQKVSGVGHNLAYKLLSHAKIEDILKAVEKNNHFFFLSIPGIGKKGSLRILVELSTLIKKLTLPSITSLSNEDKLIIEALKSLGFENKQIHQILDKIPKQISLEDQIKAALKLIK